MEANVRVFNLAFQPKCLEKTRLLRSKFRNLLIQVDGGIKLENIEQVAENGANVIVSGTGIFGKPDPKAIIQQMRQHINAKL